LLILLHPQRRLYDHSAIRCAGNAAVRREDFQFVIVIIRRQIFGIFGIDCDIDAIGHNIQAIADLFLDHHAIGRLPSILATAPATYTET